MKCLSITASSFATQISVLECLPLECTPQLKLTRWCACGFLLVSSWLAEYGLRARANNQCPEACANPPLATVAWMLGCLEAWVCGKYGIYAVFWFVLPILCILYLWCSVCGCLYTFSIHLMQTYIECDIYCERYPFFCSPLQSCSGSHEPCIVRTQVARPTGEHGLLYHNREKVCWLKSVFSYSSCMPLWWVLYTILSLSHAEKKQNLQLPWRREEWVSST